jgi:hypothetical protein
MLYNFNFYHGVIEMADTKDMIRSAFNGDAAEFSSAFGDVMDTKVQDALVAKFSAMFGGEEVESEEMDAELDAEVEESDAEVDSEETEE